MTGTPLHNDESHNLDGSDVDYARQSTMPPEWQETLWQRAADAMVVSSPDGIVLAVNHAYCQLYGYREEQLLGQPFALIFPEPYREQAHVDYQDVFTTGDSQSTHHATIQRADGTMREVESHIEFLTHGGKRVAMLSIIRDITAQVQAERGLREKNTLLERIFNTTPDLLYIYDLLEDRNVFANRNLFSMLGYTSEDVQQLGSELLSQLIHPDDYGRLAPRHARLNLLPDGVVDELEYRMRAADGTWRWLRSRDVVFQRDEQGQAWQTLGIAQDITDQKQAEANRLAMEQHFAETQKLESLGILASGLAHDFNNLLTVVRGNAELVLLDLSPSHPARSSAEQVILACQRSAELISQMLAYAGKSQTLLRTIDLNSIVAEMAILLRAAVPHTTTLDTNLTFGSTPVLADAAQLRQVVLNLVVNAAEAVGEMGGRIVLRTFVAEYDPDTLRPMHGGWHLSPGVYVVLEVADTGSGMDAATQARIFEPFFTTKATGRGLGMAAVQGIVRSHGGTIAISSTVGVGTTFHILLPLHTAQVQTAEPPVLQSTRVGGLVLVIDDEVAVRDVTHRMLVRLGYEVESVADGHTALARLQDQPERYALVLTDLTMPPPAGEAIVAHVRQLQIHLPIIVMTGYTTHDVATKLGRDLHLTVLAKPFTSTELQLAIQTALGFSPSTQ